MCDIPEEAMSFHYGWSGPRQGPTQKCTAAPRDPGHHASLLAVLCWVRDYVTLSYRLITVYLVF